MKKGFDRLRGVAVASAMGLGLLGGAGSVRALSVTTKKSVWFGTYTSTIFNSSSPPSYIVTARTKWMEIGNQSMVMGDQYIVTTGGFVLTAGQSAWGIADVKAPGGSYVLNGAMFLAVGNNLFVNPDNTVDLTDNNMTTDTVVDIIAGVDAQIQYYFNPTRPVVRALYSVTNTTMADIATSVLVMGDYWSGVNTTVHGTSDGDLIVEASDTWVASNGDVNPGGNTYVWYNDTVISSHGTGAAVVPVVAMTVGLPSGGSGQIDNFGYRYDVTIPAGETVRVMLFNEMSVWMTDALAAAPDFETLAAADAAGLLTGLTATQLSEIVNYGADADLDGALDSADAFPNDPTETTDTDGDGVGDNADAFPNDPSRSEPGGNSGSGAVGPIGLLALLGLPALLRRRKNKKQ